jgi:hypothetical protein
MMRIFDSPFAVFGVALLAQWCAAYVGDLTRRKWRPLGNVEREDFGPVVTATLTLLALIIGFSFSMAVSRYDQRKSLEEAEANAIGTEFLRADLLPSADGAKLRELLRAYVQERIAFYEGRQDGAAAEAALQAELWSAATRGPAAQPTPVAALAVAGMNEVLNAQGYARAAWWNRIPLAAWALMGLVALFANLLLGYSERRTGVLVLAVLPVVLSIAFFLIADIDSPSGGVIRVAPRNLIATQQAMAQQQQPTAPQQPTPLVQ